MYFILSLQTIQTNAIRNLRFRWPNKRLVYSFQILMSRTVRRVIYEAMEEWESTTCIRFHHRHGKYRNYGYVLFQTENKGCYATYVGYKGHGRRITINLQRQCCVYKTIVLHEIGHVLGYWHEQSRPCPGYVRKYRSGKRKQF